MEIIAIEKHTLLEVIVSFTVNSNIVIGSFAIQKNSLSNCIFIFQEKKTFSKFCSYKKNFKIFEYSQYFENIVSILPKFDFKKDVLPLKRPLFDLSISFYEECEQRLIL